MIHESGEMYLKAIYQISKRKKEVRAIDICEYMNFSKPAVSRAMSGLKQDGYVTVNQENIIFLTAKGEAAAKQLNEKNELLKDALIRIGVSEEIAFRDACKIEHHISDESLNAIKNHINRYE